LQFIADDAMSVVVKNTMSHAEEASTFGSVTASRTTRMVEYAALGLLLPHVGGRVLATQERLVRFVRAAAAIHRLSEQEAADLEAATLWAAE
jgi:hypothetical protein